MKAAVMTWVACAVAVWSGLAAAAPQELALSLRDDRVDVTVDGKLFTSYKFPHTQKYPYFFPVNGPASGESVTTETSEPYPHHHSLFFACDRVNGGNYWQDVNERGQILSQGPAIVEAKGTSVSFTDECLWDRPDKEPVIRDTRRITIAAPSETLRLIDFEITLKALDDIRILKTNHSLFSARMTPALNVLSGGAIVNAEGKRNPEEAHGVESAWCDYSGARDGVDEGLAIFQHADNRWFPAKWFLRDYGFMSPTNMNWIEGDRLKLAEGETWTMKYRVVVHAGDVEEAGIAKLYEDYKNLADGG
ncbi:MAG: hypothetical protein GWP08_00575 [Nitrospiraceae bacterium]|nr:hypothetical protein [Nitrospiraceae bacterium]